MRWLIGVLVGAAVAAVPTRALACAGCSNPNLPVGRTSDAPVEKGQWQIGVALSGTSIRVVHESACPDIGSICSVRDEPPNLHDLRLLMGEVRAIVEHGLTDHFGWQLQLPFKVVNSRITYRHLDGTAFVPDYESIHHHNETLFGITDPWLTGRWSGKVGSWGLTGRLGTTIPIGATVEDPFKLGHEGKPHQHIQFGTGTFNPLIMLETQRSGETYFGSGYAQAQIVAYENRHGFQAGHRLGVGVMAGRAFGKVRVALGADVMHEESERWGGIVQQDGNLGRTDVLAGGNVLVPMGKQSLMLSVRTPVYQHINGGQLTYPAIVSLAWSTTVGGKAR